MVNKIKKKCPECGYEESDILCAVTTSKIVDKKTTRTSWNVYRCLNPKGKKHQFRVQRNGNSDEQKLTEKYIKSESINP